jgi:hypothetical protein
MQNINSNNYDNNVCKSPNLILHDSGDAGKEGHAEAIPSEPAGYCAGFGR